MPKLGTFPPGQFDLNDKITVTDGTTGETQDITFQQFIDEVIILITAAKGPWATIVINAITFYHFKGNGKLLSTLEETDKLIGDENGQLIVYTYLDDLGDPNDLNNSSIWDKNSIG